MADSSLQRTHPATVAVRTAQTLWQSGIWLVGLLVFGTLGNERAIPVLILAGIIAGVVLLIAGSRWISWWRFEYGIVGTDLLIEEGLFVRKRRTIPIARVHGVNVRADLFMRALGVVELVVQTAGGGANEPEAKIGAIRLDRAEELRNALLFETPDSVAQEPVDLDPVGRIGDYRGAFGGAEVRGHEVLFEHKVPFRQLLLGEATSRRVPILFAVVVGIVGQFYEVLGQQFIDGTASRAAQFALPALMLLLAVLGLLLLVVATAIGVVRNFEFTTRRYETRIEIEAGLLERRQVSIPVGRMQAVRIEASWLRHLLGLVAIEVDTAGLERGGQQSGQMTASKAMVPVARAADMTRLIHGLLPEAEVFPDTEGLATRALRFYILLPTVLTTITSLAVVGPLSWFVYRPALPWAGGLVVAVALITIGVRALQWRRAGIGTDDVALAIRSGLLGIKRVRLTRSRIQSLEVRQNPFQRRARLASLRTTSVSGSSRASYGVSHLDEAAALHIMRWYEDGLVRGRDISPGHAPHDEDIKTDLAGQT